MRTQRQTLVSGCLHSGCGYRRAFYIDYVRFADLRAETRLHEVTRVTLTIVEGAGLGGSNNTVWDSDALRSRGGAEGTLHHVVVGLLAERLNP